MTALHPMPNTSDLITDIPRATFETIGLARYLTKQRLKDETLFEPHPVLLFPGYGGTDGSMTGLKYFLNNLGLSCYSLGLGRNFEGKDQRIGRVEQATAFREKMVALCIERAEAIYQATGQKLILLGWSMGGCYAFDVSQAIPDKVAAVITMGSPFGDPRGTSMWPIFRYFMKNPVPVEDMDFSGWMEKRKVTSKGIPIHVLYSKRDGIVSTTTAMLEKHPDVSYSQVKSSHTGFAYNKSVYKEVLAKLKLILAQ